MTFILSVPWQISSAADALAAVFHATAQQAASMAVSAVWQGALIAGGLALFLRLAPRTSAAHRFSVWAAAFVALVSLPLFSLLSSSEATVAGGAVRASSAAAANAWFSRPWLSLDARWTLWIGGLWAAATLWRAGDLVLHSVRLRGLWKDALPVEVESSLNAMLAPAATAWHRGPVQVCTTATLQRPSVIGFFKPRILIPDWLFARLTAGELEQIVLHEAEHLRRHDDWTNLLQKVCLVLFPLNPALYWIEHRLCREREMACDDGVIRVTHAPRAYAACLASLAERGLQHRAEALSLGAWQRRPELVHRVHSILRSKHVLSAQGSRALLGALGCGLVFGSVALARCPQLVVFVPARSLDHRDVASGTALDRSPIADSRRGNAASAAARSAEKKPVSPAVHAARTWPESGSAHRAEADAQMQSAGVEQVAAALGETTPYGHAAQAPSAVMIETQWRDSKATPVREEQWVVLAKWEQVQTPNSGLRADYETGTVAGDAQSSAVASRQAGAQPVSQITVTQLIFRIIPVSAVPAGVVPASSTAGSGPGSAHGKPVVAPMHNGWFVLQL